MSPIQSVLHTNCPRSSNCIIPLLTDNFVVLTIVRAVVNLKTKLCLFFFFLLQISRFFLTLLVFLESSLCLLPSELQ